MTNADIDQFIDKLKMIKATVVRQRGDETNPTKELSYRYSAIAHAPQVAVEHEGSTDFYEFEKAYSPLKLNDLISKWILFGIKAKMLSGKFYLVVRENDKVKFSKIIKGKALDVELITITEG